MNWEVCYDQLQWEDFSQKKKNERKIISYNNIEEDIDTTILFPLLKVFDTQRGLLN